MKIAIRYYSRSGNTKKIADAIGKAINVKAESTDSVMNEDIDLLFLGGSVYAGGVDKQLSQFITTLKPENIKLVAVFSTSAISETGNNEISKQLQAQGLQVAPKDFYCKGKFLLMHRGHPNDEDLSKAAAFAKSFI